MSKSYLTFISLLLFVLLLGRPVSAQFTDEEKTLVTSAYAHIQKGELESALSELNLVLKKNPGNYSAYFFRGLARFLTYDLQGAIDDYSKAIQIAPKAKNIERVYNGRAGSYFFLKETDKSLADYNKAIDINPSYVDPYVGRGNILLNKGEANKALADYSKAIELEPRTTAAYVGRADVYFEKDEIQKALADLNTSIDQIENLAGSHLKRGAVYGLTGKWQLAVTDIARAADINSQSRTPYWGQLKVSLEDIDKFVTRNPRNGRAFAVRGIIYLFRGMPAEAQKDLEEAYRLDSSLRTELKEHLKPLQPKVEVLSKVSLLSQNPI